MIDIFLKAMALLVFALASAAATARSAEVPNVLFIAIDDLNDWIGCLDGHPQAKTPNIDALAARGILFTNAHCAAPACNPSRAAVFSGRMPYNNDVWSNKSAKLLNQHPDLMVLPRAFSRAGYQTLGTGKLLHSRSSNQDIFQQSFNPEQRWSPLTKDLVRYTQQELPTKGTDDPRHIVNIEGRAPIVLPLNRMPSDRNPGTADGESFDWGPMDVPDSAMGDAQIADWAIERMNEGFDKPFFLGVGFYRPHIPLWAPKKYFQRFTGDRVVLPDVKANDLDDLSDSGRRWAIEAVTAGSHSTVAEHRQWEHAVTAYLACTTFVDHQVGRLIDALDAGRFGDNTVIVLWSDHGWHLGEKQHWGKWTPWERSTRVPLMIVPPKNQADGFANAGSRCDRPVSLVDLYPTLVELCSVRPPEELDGQSLVPLLRAPSGQTDRTVVTTFDRGNVTLRDSRWRYVRYADGSEELYDHDADPNEWEDLSGDPKLAPRLLEYRQRVPKRAIGG